MAYSFKYIEHTADVAIEASGSSVEELFHAAAEGWKEIVLEDSEVLSLTELNINLEQDSGEELLASFLDELNFQLNTRLWIFSAVNKLVITNEENIWKLDAVLSGENLNPEKHEIKVEIKAVTFHQMQIRHINNTFFSIVVFDI
jgi:SHS2 domain-containing protein